MFQRTLCPRISASSHFAGWTVYLGTQVLSVDLLASGIMGWCKVSTITAYRLFPLLKDVQALTSPC